MAKKKLPISDEIIRKYGLHGIVEEKYIEDFDTNENLIARTIHRKRINFIPILEDE